MNPKPMTRWQKFCHFLEHVALRNPGGVVTWWEGDRLLSGFKCQTCGHVQAAHVICVRPDPNEFFNAPEAGFPERTEIPKQWGRP